MRKYCYPAKDKHKKTKYGTLRSSMVISNHVRATDVLQSIVTKQIGLFEKSAAAIKGI
jgi:hypothetical protein